MIEVLDHHIKSEPCTTRPAYRAGKTPKSVKVATLNTDLTKRIQSLFKICSQVYTCAQESKYLLITNIPSVNLDVHMTKLFETYGTIEEHKPLHGYPSEPFCEAFLIKFCKIQNARYKKFAIRLKHVNK